jgi:protein-tyrosine phosphatase
MAEVIFNSLVENKNLNLISDSAGTGSWHVGDDMDSRARLTLKKHGYEPKTHVAKQIDSKIISDRDFLIALDTGHKSYLEKAVKRLDLVCGPIYLLSEFINDKTIIDIPDPYYGNLSDFELAFNLIERACKQFVNYLGSEFN